MSRQQKAKEDLFDPQLYYPTLVLIRIPRDLNEKKPAADAEFGSGFFGAKGLVFTVRHNLIDKKTGKPLPWVWVCCYDKNTRDWTDFRRVAVDPDLLDASCDAALLRVPGNTPSTLPLSFDWKREDDVAVIGFQPRPSGAGSGFWPWSASCVIPKNWPVDAQDIEDPTNQNAFVREPFLGLLFTAQAQQVEMPVKGGFSGGPVADLRHKIPRVIAVEKAVMPRDAEIYKKKPWDPANLPDWVIRLLGPSYVLATPLHWFQPLLDRLPLEKRPLIHRPGEERQQALEAYLAYIRKKCDSIELAGIEGVDEKVLRSRPTMDDLYMPLHLHHEPERWLTLQDIRSLDMRSYSIVLDSGGTEVRPRGARPKLTISEGLSKHRLIVVLGAPGSGKSTLIKFIALACVSNRAAECGLPQFHNAPGQSVDNLIPLLILFREHRPAQGAAVPSFDEILHRLCELSTAEPALRSELFELFKSALSQGRCVVLLDGLDEVSNVEGAREMMAERVTEWAHQYPNCRFIITSRIIGYQPVRAKIGSEFQHFTLCDFEPADMDQFIENWCRAVEPTPDLAAQQAESLRQGVHRNPRVERLARNPLLLTVLALVHRRGGGLPNRRVKLYEKAVEVLLESWGRSGGREPIPLDQSLPQLQFVARKMMEAGQQQITKDDLLRLLIEARNKIPYLKSIATLGPRELIDRVEERSGLLIEVGPDVYQFRHLSFQEYLTARAIIEDFDPETGEQRDPFLAIEPFLMKESWQEVVRLCAVSLGQRASSFVKRIAEFRPQSESLGHQIRPIHLAALCLADGVSVTAMVADEILGNLAKDVSTPSLFYSELYHALGSRCWAELVHRGELDYPARDSFKPITLDIYAELRRSKYKQQAASHLIRWMKIKPPSERPCYAAALLQLEWPLPSEIIQEACQDLRESQRWQDRVWAAHTLHWLDERVISAQVLTSLVDAIQKDEEASVRAEAAQVLGDFYLLKFRGFSWYENWRQDMVSKIQDALGRETDEEAMCAELRVIFHFCGPKYLEQTKAILQKRLTCETSNELRQTISACLKKEFTPF